MQRVKQPMLMRTIEVQSMKPYMRHNDDVMNPTPVYECDPTKHTECTKEMCFINGGPCHKTLHEKYKKENSDETV
jgi:hypothetical protein